MKLCVDYLLQLEHCSYLHIAAGVLNDFYWEKSKIL